MPVKVVNLQTGKIEPSTEIVGLPVLQPFSTMEEYVSRWSYMEMVPRLLKLGIIINNRSHWILAPEDPCTMDPPCSNDDLDMSDYNSRLFAVDRMPLNYILSVDFIQQIQITQFHSAEICWDCEWVGRKEPGISPSGDCSTVLLTLKVPPWIVKSRQFSRAETLGTSALLRDGDVVPFTPRFLETCSHRERMILG